MSRQIFQTTSCCESKYLIVELKQKFSCFMFSVFIHFRVGRCSIWYLVSCCCSVEWNACSLSEITNCWRSHEAENARCDFMFLFPVWWLISCTNQIKTNSKSEFFCFSFLAIWLFLFYYLEFIQKVSSGWFIFKLQRKLCSWFMGPF